MSDLKGIIKQKLNQMPLFINILNQMFMGNQIRVKESNSCEIKRLLRKSKITVNGFNNSIVINDISEISTIDIVIIGNDNEIYVDENVFCKTVTLWIEDDHNSIRIGKGTALTGRIQLSAIEGTKIEIGENCLFSDNIDVRSGDGHSILDEEGNRTNYSADIYIGDHVWCGKDVSILKGGGGAFRMCDCYKSSNYQEV